MIIRMRARRDLLFAAASAASLIAGAAAGALAPGGAAAGIVAVAWLLVTVRLLRLTPYGPGGRPPGSAGVREPRRPLPLPPADAIALPEPHDG